MRGSARTPVLRATYLEHELALCLPATSGVITAVPEVVTASCADPDQTPLGVYGLLIQRLGHGRVEPTRFATRGVRPEVAWRQRAARVPRKAPKAASSTASMTMKGHERPQATSIGTTVPAAPEVLSRRVPDRGPAGGREMTRSGPSRPRHRRRRCARLGCVAKRSRRSSREALPVRPNSTRATRDRR